MDFEQIEFRTQDNSLMIFVFSGTHRYQPNKAMASGDGSDTWMFLGKLKDQNCILSFCYSAEYGSGSWSCVLISKKEAQLIEETNGEALLSTYYDHFHPGEQIFLHLHPVSFDPLKAIIQSDDARDIKLTDRDYDGV